jgi:cytochrome P450
LSRLSKGSAEAPVERPDELDRSFEYFHKPGIQISWWNRDGGYWFISSYDLLSKVAADHEGFSSRHDLPNGVTDYLGVMIPPSPIATPPLELDPPGHTVMRGILKHRLSADAVRAQRPKIERLTNGYLDGFVDVGRLDIYALAQLVCSATVLEIVGLPADLAGILGDASQLEPTMSKKAEMAWGRLIEHLASTVTENRHSPGENLIGDLCKSGDDFSDGHIMETAVTFLLGGAMSPVKLLLDSFRYLATHPSDRLLLTRDHKVRPTAIEEFLRFFSPQEMIARTATRDTELGGELIKAGDRVVLGFSAANRDPSVFHDPNIVKFDRKPNPHLAMGRGIHHCLGAALGRAEVSIVVDRVLTRIPDFRLAAPDDDSRVRMRPLIIEF